jgi:acyl carrier protein
VLAPPRRHVPLPAYPWQRERHWLAEGSGNGHLTPMQDESEPAPPAPAPSPDQAVDYVLYVRERVAAGAGLGLDEVTEDLPLEDLGLSSLTIVELRNQVERELGIVVPLAALLGGGTPVDLALAIHETIDANGLGSSFVTGSAQQRGGG